MVHYDEFLRQMDFTRPQERHAFHSAMCFEMPPLDELACLCEVPDLMRLPYPSCWFEGDGIAASGTHIPNGAPIKGRIGVILFQVGPEEPIHCEIFVRMAGGFVTEHVAIWDRSIDRWIDDPLVKALADPLIRERAIVPNLHYVGAFLSLLNCENIGRIRNDPPPKLQRARQRRGKRPLFSYWTLALAPRHRGGASSAACGDGAHSSPRLHLRRGHIRRMDAGRHCWVRACVVGNKAAGMVHKDYAVRT